jgi:hypothetical protein
MKRSRSLLRWTLATALWGAAAPLALADPDADANVAALLARWAGVYDLTEQIFFDAAPELTRPPGTQIRLQVAVTPVVIPWLAPQVLYLEERPFDEPGSPRRQVLLSLTPGQQPGTVRVQQYTFRRPGSWLGLQQRPAAIRRLTVADIEAHPGCDLLLVREAGQFRGGTLTRSCRDRISGQYIEYQLLLGDDLYWYRQRTLALADDELRREVAGYTLVDVENARLFTCEIRWRATPSAAMLTLLTLDLHDQGGRGNFVTPDLQHWRITLFGRDWPFANGLDALQLVLEGREPPQTLASSWTSRPGRALALEYDKLSVHCAPVVAESDDVPA